MKKVFIIHGWTYSTDKWKTFVAQMLEADIECVIFNVPGLTEQTDRAWTLDDYVDWLDKKFQNEKQKVVIVGHSNGGRIAGAFAARHSEKIELLVLIDSAGIQHNEIGIRLKRAIFKTTAKLGKKITSSSKLRSLLYKLAKESDYKNAEPHMQQTMANVISIDLTPQLNRITAPTLIIWGKKDTATPLSDGQMIHSLIKKSSLHIIDEAGHSPHFTHPRVIADKIIRELREHANF